MARKPKPQDKPQVNAELTGFEITINEFGEISSSYDVSKLNEFLDRNVSDKKFRDIDVVRREEKEAQDVGPKRYSPETDE